MSRFMIEIIHSSEPEGCLKSLSAIMDYGSHLVTRAEFGCEDGVHSGWLVVDADNRDEAKLMVPPPYRADARVVHLRTWTREQIEEMIKELEGA